MTVTIKIIGEGISVERVVSQETAPRLIEMVMSGEGEDPDTITVSIEGAGISYEREISEDVAPRLLKAAIRNGKNGGEHINTPDGGDYGEGVLPDDFFRRITPKQEALIRILLEADDWMLNEDVRQKMEDEFGYSVDGGRGTAGILSGISRKWTKEFRKDMIEANWVGDEVEFRLNDEYEEDLRAGLD